MDDGASGAHENSVGGSLKAATYISRLFGGLLLVKSVVLDNFTSIEIHVDGKTATWDVRRSILTYRGWDSREAYDFSADLYKALQAKEDAGFEIFITDALSRALSHRFSIQLKNAIYRKPG